MTTERGLTSKQGVADQGWGKSALGNVNNKATLLLSLALFFHGLGKYSQGGKTWPELCIRRLVMTHLQN